VASSSGVWGWCSSRPFAIEVDEQEMRFKIDKYKHFQWLAKMKQVLRKAEKSYGVEKAGCADAMIVVCPRIITAAISCID
jgi:hypothetical protein